MSFHVRPSGQGDRLNIITNISEIKNVRSYGKVAGTMAKLMGVAAEIRGNDNKSYFVNIRSLGKEQKDAESASPPDSDTPKKGLTARIKQSFENRIQKKEHGKTLITTAKEISEGIENFCKQTQSKEKLLNEISKLKWDESNLGDVFSSLESAVKEISDGEFLGVDLNLIFQPRVTEHAKLQFIKTFREQLESKPQASESLPKEKDIGTSLAINCAINLVFQQNINQPNFKQTVSNKISELLLNKKNLDDVYKFLKLEIDKNLFYSSSYDQNQLEGLDENQKLELIQLCRNRVDNTRPENIKWGVDLLLEKADLTDKEQLKGLSQLQTKIQSNKDKKLGTIMEQEAAAREIVEIVKNKMLDAVNLENKKYMENLFDSLELSEQEAFIDHLQVQLSQTLAENE